MRKIETRKLSENDVQAKPVKSDEDARGDESDKDREDNREDNPEKDTNEKSEPDWLVFLRCHLAELLGTFALTLVATGGPVIKAVSHGEVSYTAQALAPGLTVMAMIYALGDVSGAHINPAVTLAFTLRHDFP